MDMNWIMFAGLVTLWIIIILLQLKRLRRKTLNQLYVILYENNDPATYEVLLNNRHFKLLFTNEAIQSLKLEGWIASDQEEKILAFQRLAESPEYSVKYNVGNLRMLLNYWCRKKNRVEAEKILNVLRTKTAGAGKKQKEVLENVEKVFHQAFPI